MTLISRLHWGQPQNVQNKKYSREIYYFIGPETQTVKLQEISLFQIEQESMAESAETLES